MFFRSGSRAAATSKMERFEIIVNGRNPFILDVAAALDPPLVFLCRNTDNQCLNGVTVVKLVGILGTGEHFLSKAFLKIHFLF